MLNQERLDKLNKIKTLGINPYAEKFDHRQTTKEVLKKADQDKFRQVTEIQKEFSKKNLIRLAGRLMSYRSHGKINFAHLQDTSGKIQICFNKGITKVKDLNEEQMPTHKFWEKMLDIADFIGIEGEFFITQHGESTILVKEITFLSKSLRQLPEKWHGLKDTECCYRQRYLELTMKKEILNRFKIRSEVVKEIRNFFHSKNFHEVETRTLQPQAGGAMARVFETHHNALDHEFALRIALELDLKMLIGGGFERVFEIGKCFRNEGMDPSHLQEFTMLEWYAAYSDLQKNMQWMEEMVKVVLKKTLQKTKINVLDPEENQIEVDFDQKWPKVKFADLLKQYADIDMETITRAEAKEIAVKKYGLAKEEADKIGRGNLLDHIYKKSARKYLIQPTFVMDYPSVLKPLARPKKDGSADCYQLLVAGWEIMNAYGELIDPVVQRKLLEEQAEAKAGGDEEAMEVDEEFITAMEHGFPPMTGFGMGIDRFVALIVEQSNLRDVVLLPLMKPKQNQNKSQEQQIDYSNLKIPTREQALNLIEKYVEDYSKPHLRAVEEVMRHLAKRFKEDENIWGIVGLLHDIDWDDINKDGSKHCQERMDEILAEIKMPLELVEAIKAHNHELELPLDTKLKKALFCIDELTGFIFAVTKVRPDKKIASVKLKSVKKKLKDKAFAANVSREHMNKSEELLNIPQLEMVEIILEALQPIGDELGL